MLVLFLVGVLDLNLNGAISEKKVAVTKCAASVQYL